MSFFFHAGLIFWQEGARIIGRKYDVSLALSETPERDAFNGCECG